jgi:hypothetical protein
MDFDHQDGYCKWNNIGAVRGGGYSLQRIEEEACKCQVVCVNCHRIRTQRQQQLRGYVPKRKRRQSAVLIRNLKDVPCIDCGVAYPACAMDFDHQDGYIKRKEVSQLAGAASILDEAAKCEIVCANCHRIRTHGRLHQKTTYGVVSTCQ